MLFVNSEIKIFLLFPEIHDEIKCVKFFQPRHLKYKSDHEIHTLNVTNVWEKITNSFTYIVKFHSTQRIHLWEKHFVPSSSQNVFIDNQFHFFVFAFHQQWVDLFSLKNKPSIRNTLVVEVL